LQLKGDGSVACVEKALEFIGRQAKRQKPFLAVVWTGSPHGGHRPEEQDLAPYQGKPGAKFYGEIAGVDRAVGMLRRGLRDLEIADDTLVWFCSDNGGDHKRNGPLRGGKRDLWEGGLRVPGCIEWPAAIKPGARSAIPASTVDMLPTLAALAGVKDVKARGPLDGIDLSDLLTGTMKSRPKPIPFEFRGTYGLIDNRYKIIVGPPSPVKATQKDDRVHLYDILTDTGEQTDLAKSRHEVFEEMLEQARQWHQEATAGDAPLESSLDRVQSQ
jgi:arylsulfatase A-like enzyme